MSINPNKQPCCTVEKVEDKSFDLNSVRCYLPGFVVKSQCPQCQKPAEINLENVYLYFPVVNEPSFVYFDCGNPCFNEWEEQVILRISLETVKNM